MASVKGQCNLCVSSLKSKTAMGNSGFATFFFSGQDSRARMAKTTHLYVSGYHSMIGSIHPLWGEHPGPMPFACFPLHHLHSVLHSVHVRFPSMVSMRFLTVHLMGYILWQSHKRKAGGWREELRKVCIWWRCSPSVRRRKNCTQPTGWVYVYSLPRFPLWS